jgi:hypothetical protein
MGGRRSKDLKRGILPKPNTFERGIARYLSDDTVSSDGEFVELLRNQLEPRVQAASLKPMKGKKVRGSGSRRS